MTALKYWDGTNWVTIGSVPGQAGVLATQRKGGALAFGTQTAGFTAVQNRLYDRGIGAASTLPIEITYTPPVDCYWEVHGHVGEMVKQDANYHYGDVALTITPADADGVTLGANSRETQHSTVQTHMNYQVRKVFRLSAGVKYTAYLSFTPQAGTWAYGLSPGELFIEGKAWPLLSATPPAAQSTQVLDVLPSTPVDGQLINFQTAAMRADGTIWRLRYNIGAAGTSKWEYMGGAPLVNDVLADQSRLGTAWGNMTTVGPSVDTPLPGYYDVEFGAHITLPTNAPAFTAMLAPKFGAAAVDETNDTISIPKNTSLGSLSITWPGQRLLPNRQMVAAGTILLQYRCDAAINVNFGRRWLKVTPRRVG